MKRRSNTLTLYRAKSHSSNTFSLKHSKQKRSRSHKSINTKSTSRTIQSKCNYKLSTQHIHFLMEQQRMKELQTIKSSPSLLDYYQTLNSLLTIIYKTSKMILTYMYYNKTRQLKVDRLQILNALMGNFTDCWNSDKIKKMEVLSTNLYQMSTDQKDFQKRVQYVARKLCNNKQKKQKIEKAYLNKSLKQHWRNIIEKAQHFHKNDFIHDMFNSYSKKLCFLDVRSFLNNSLSKVQFKEKIEQLCNKHEIDEDFGLNYTFQFVLLQEFSFEQFKDIQTPNFPQKVSSKNNQCCIM